MEPEFLSIIISTLFLALIIDIIFGEPRGFLHIAVISGKWSMFIGRAMQKSKKLVRAGWITALLTVIPITIFFGIVFDFLYSLPLIYIFFLIFYAIIAKSTFAFTSMGSHINPIIKSLENGDMDSARVLTSRCVRRDVSELNEPLLISAAIETVAEGITDSFTGSLLYFSIFGVLGSIVYRIVNTLDSTFGYRDKKYLKFGRASAAMDTILNYIPARISSALISISAYMLNYSNRKSLLSSVLNSVPSRNAAYSMGTMAIVLNLKLEKKGSYVINRKGFDPTLGDLKKALRIFYFSFFLMVIFVTIPLILIFSYILYPHIFFLFPIKIVV
jgi:adenosylcobinamide-phosphate synthase